MVLRGLPGFPTENSGVERCVNMAGGEYDDDGSKETGLADGKVAENPGKEGREGEVGGYGTCRL